MYKEQFLQTLKHGIYRGAEEHSDLRIIYQNVISALKQYSIVEKNGEYPVIVTEVDEDYITKRTRAALDFKVDGTGKYDKQEIIDAVLSNMEELNSFLRSEAKDMRGSIMPLYTTAELRKKGFLC